MQLVTTDLSDHQILRRKAQLVTFPLNEETQQEIKTMTHFFESLASPFTRPAGLAAPQVGIDKQIIIIQIPKEAKIIRKDVYDELPPTFFINPTFSPINAAEKAVDWEACYSVTDKMGEVERYYQIQYHAYTLTGKEISGMARGFFARVMQHEIDHLMGQLYIDLLTSTSRFGAMDKMMAIRQQEFNIPK